MDRHNRVSGLILLTFGVIFFILAGCDASFNKRIAPPVGSNHILPVKYIDLGYGKCGASAVISILKYYRLSDGKEPYIDLNGFLRQKEFIDNLQMLIMMRAYGIESELNRFELMTLLRDLEDNRPSIVMVLDESWLADAMYGRERPAHSMILCGVDRARGRVWLCASEDGPMPMELAEFDRMWKSTDRTAIRIIGYPRKKPQHKLIHQ